MRTYRVAKADLAALLAADGVVATGASFSAVHGLGLSSAQRAEASVHAALVPRLTDAFLLVPSAQGNVRLRAVDGDWHLLASGPPVRGRLAAPRLIVAVDLLDETDARARAAGRALLHRLAPATTAPSPRKRSRRPARGRARPAAQLTCRAARLSPLGAQHPTSKAEGRDQPGAARSPSPARGPRPAC